MTGFPILPSHLTFLSACLFATLAQAEIRLSPGGPINTPEAAREAARKTTKPVQIIVEDGIYPLTEPLTLGLEDSGVTWTAAPGAKPVFSGGHPITDWQKLEDDLWKADIPDVRSGKWYFQQLWINGRRATRARTPNKGFLHMLSQASSEIFPAEKPGDPAWDGVLRYNSFITSRETSLLLEKIAADELPDVSLTIPHTWDVHHYRLRALNLEANAVLMRGPRIRELLTYEPDGRFFVENYRAALDAPGEWFLNRQGELFYHALPGEDLVKAEVFAPATDMLLKIDQAKDITFRGIAFKHQQWLMGQDGFGVSQAAQSMGAAVEIDRSQNIGFDQCEIAHSGGYALWYHLGCEGGLVQHSHIHDLGAGGVRIGPTSKGDAPPNVSSFITVDNNIIQHGGRIFPDAVAVFVGHASDNVVTHNDIGDFYYSGISSGWHWGYGETVSHRNRYENNHIHHLGWGYTSDMGGFYNLGTAFGTVVRGNHIHHVSSYRYGGWGLYTDEGSTGVLMENNLVHDTSESCFHQHYGFYNTVRNNIFAFGSKAQLQRSRNEAHLSFIVERNLFVWDPQSEFLHGGKYNWDFTAKRNHGDPRLNYILRHNLYWPLGGKLPEFVAKTWTWDEWMKTGHDTGSIVADPHFKDLAKRDFHLPADSPALKIGFKPWDLSVAGVRSDSPRGPEWRELAARSASFPDWDKDAKPWPSPGYRIALETFEYRSLTPPTLVRQKIHTENKGDAILVTDEAASPIPLPEGAPSGRARRSLKLQDAPNLSQSYNPHYILNPAYKTGVITWNFDIMAKEDAPWYAELRSETIGNAYKVGPRVSWKNGQLSIGPAHKPIVVDLPAGQWARLETTSQPGHDQWSLTLTLQDGVRHEFSELASDPGWDNCETALWSSLATTATAVYLDNLRLDNRPE